MTDLTLREKKQLLLDAIQTVDQITEGVKDNYPFNDTEGVQLDNGEPWDARNYKTFLIRKLGAIEYELQNTEEDTSNTEEETTNTHEGNEEQVTQQEQDNKDEKEEEEEVKP